MQFLKTLFWVLLAVIIVLFASRNWFDVEVKLWGDIVVDIWPIEGRGRSQ